LNLCSFVVFLRTFSMRRHLALLLLPLWLGFASLAGAWVSGVPAGAKAHAANGPVKETKLHKVEAAPLVGHQMQVPVAEWCATLPELIVWPVLPSNYRKHPLRANGTPSVLRFGHRFLEHAIALRAP
jgi:hypothetical protein